MSKYLSAVMSLHLNVQMESHYYNVTLHDLQYIVIIWTIFSLVFFVSVIIIILFIYIL